MKGDIPMDEPVRKEAFLDDLRVLDLADEKSVYCGQILAALGAEVIKIEKPGGDAMRDNGSFYQDIPNRERSLYWWHFNTNKKSITLNIETVDGRNIFERLAKTSNIVIETYAPGYLLWFMLKLQLKTLMPHISFSMRNNGRYRECGIVFSLG
jgi:crotonobetainyl-CoA:carnitine CoA-transferase CaiB-like acyl-CoA transferase